MVCCNRKMNDIYTNTYEPHSLFLSVNYFTWDTRNTFPHSIRRSWNRMDSTSIGAPVCVCVCIEQQRNRVRERETGTKTKTNEKKMSEKSWTSADRMKCCYDSDNGSRHYSIKVLHGTSNTLYGGKCARFIHTNILVDHQCDFCFYLFRV